MNIKPLHDRVVVRQVEEQKESTGGILLPGSAQEKENLGEVVAVGPGKAADNGSIIPMTVKVGDKVMFGQYSGQEVKDDAGKPLKVMREDDIIAIVE
ncbi:10 kDa chaperonin [Hydrogenovibrio crunogenus]|uniref:Co-chaperonin GroES n=2 Tax=Hydrogenovibrio crunogenus TaxID=39765 RepID=CH10_HYDCU|nr:co-chaperone GroES [Hydrogenovibrio crunogenus]Q31IT2.1 RecName: Full=Co-chaperonin GroES; AltName: Full=10 kDa chaperonin; AltName: Full=Chaperonin-10; Short=Cpn10 [Hydrogenovibrio crunogenus XCL-2]QBZ82324.1 10 kDa chaperonin [Hydrogenovibrio crunogenus]RUM91570.1 MAG: co-chaperone GroES [Thiomicrospira sp.]